MQASPSAHRTPRPKAKKPRSYTWDDFIALRDDDKRELIDGQLIEVEAPSKVHEVIVAALCLHLGLWARKNGGLVLGSGYKIRITSKRGVMPDVHYFTATNPGSSSPEMSEKDRPDLAVEVISPSSGRYDRKTKLGWYAEIGVPEYWLVDPDLRMLQRHVLRDGQYAIADSPSDSELFKPASFPGLGIPLGEFWES